MPLSDTIKTLIRNAWDDGYPCLLATHGPQGPNITPKGSMIVFDDAHLAWWERSKRAVLENLSHDKRVCVMYANFKAQRDGVLESGFLRFFGSVELHESGSMREAILPSCCRASRPMPVPRPASASSSRSKRRLIFAASRLCDDVVLGQRRRAFCTVNVSFNPKRTFFRPSMHAILPATMSPLGTS